MSTAIWKMVPIYIFFFFFLCLEGKKSWVFREFGEFHGGFFNFVFSYDVSLDGGFLSPLSISFVDFLVCFSIPSYVFSFVYF